MNTGGTGAAEKRNVLSRARHEGRLTVPHSRCSNWIHPALRVVDTGVCGLGVVTRDPVARGVTIIVYGGQVITLAEFERLPEAMQSFPYQIDDELFLGPHDEEDIGIGERVNHSCAPNVGFKGQLHLVALRDIDPWEEILMDYATCVSADDDAFVMECRCGAEGCRGVITGHDWRLPTVRQRLLPYFQPYLQEKVRRLTDETPGNRDTIQRAAVV